MGPAELRRRRRRCLELVGLVTERPSAYGPLLRRLGGLEGLLAQRELEIGAEPCGEPLERLEVPAPDRLLVTYVDEGYPPQLADLFDPPPALFVVGARAAGDLAPLARLPLVAVVGTRAPSRYGREMAGAISRGLVQAGVCVVSGLALGIDALVHRAALETTSAALPTVAVLGCGADVVYPRTNARLYAEVARRGLVISEYPWGTPARPWRFPARNRIIAGLSRAVVVVEGAADSGSLFTAEYALDTGRPVFAVPGEAGRRLSAAPHGLLRAGAHVCESAADVLSLLGLEVGGPAWSAGLPAPFLPHGDGLCTALLSALDDGEASVDALVGRLDAAAPAVTAALSLLEVEGLVTAVGGRYRLSRGGRRKD